MYVRSHLLHVVILLIESKYSFWFKVWQLHAFLFDKIACHLSCNSSYQNSMPWWYPSNRKEYLNGTSFSDESQIPNSDTIIAMEGVESPEWYRKQLYRKHFGFNVPKVFHGYNAERGPFPFWNSDPYTYVSAMLSLVKFDSISS